MKVLNSEELKAVSGGMLYEKTHKTTTIQKLAGKLILSGLLSLVFSAFKM